jgi:hypothetical protein
MCDILLYEMSIENLRINVATPLQPESCMTHLLLTVVNIESVWLYI